MQTVSRPNFASPRAQRIFRRFCGCAEARSFFVPPRQHLVSEEGVGFSGGAVVEIMLGWAEIPRGRGGEKFEQFGRLTAFPALTDFLESVSA